MSTLKRKRAAISTSRYEVIFDHKPWTWEQFTLGELRALGHRVGFALGHAYARAAGSVLAKIERIEDLSAERTYRQKSKQTS